MSVRILPGLVLGAVVSSLFVLGGGCLSRPVVTGIDNERVSLHLGYSTNQIDKIDILFDIDNSSSMGDKQQYLQGAVPDLITRLVQPNCIDGMGNNVIVNGVQLIADATTGTCTTGQPEFPAVHDMHIGVLTSSLGARGTTTICQTPTTPDAGPVDYNEYTSGSYAQFQASELGGLSFISKNNDDQAHLINRTDPTKYPNNTTTALAGNFLAWVPAGAGDTPPVNGLSETNAQNLVSDFQELVVGAQAYGCGIESQLESWYRFLIQPDPYASIVTSTNAVAAWSGVDNTILQQRADFLRPDSLVLIVVLTDENDSEVDVRSIGGAAVGWLDSKFAPPLPTSICATSPMDPSCTSCGFGTNPTDPNCKMKTPYAADLTNWAYNDNLRHVHMKQKYGVDVQFPINRYVLGLTSQKVPNRDGEYPTVNEQVAQFYQGGLNSDPQDLNCINPLFATHLPTSASSAGAADPNLCNLTPNPVRTPTSKLVYYAHIGGVPNELLTTTASDGTITPKTALQPSDWTSILGADPENYNFAGIDPHMIESYQPRTGVPLNTAGPPVGDEAGDWVTDGEPTATFPTRVNLQVDREYACVFKLAQTRNCDPNSMTNPESDISSCDCSTAGPGGTPPTLPADHVPAVCNKQNPLQQDYAKAYPTVRELLLAEKLGTQGIVSSLCPIHPTDNTAGNDPLYGYRPAITSIIATLKTSLGATCLPQTLAQNDAGAVPCLVLVTLPDSPGQDNSLCGGDASVGPSLTTVDKDILAEFKIDQAAEAEAGGTDLSQFTTCQISQVLPSAFLGGTCANNDDPSVQGSEGWCYITGTGSCPQSLQFSKQGLPNHGIVSLQCLENTSDFANSTGAGGSAPVVDAGVAGE